MCGVDLFPLFTQMDSETTLLLSVFFNTLKFGSNFSDFEL